MSRGDGLERLRQALLAVLPDPAVEVGYRRQLAREAYERGIADGQRAGFAAAVEGYKRAQQDAVTHLETYARRWRVPCRECRRWGLRDGCSRCEDRIRETYGRPHPDDRGAVA